MKVLGKTFKTKSNKIDTKNPYKTKPKELKRLNKVPFCKKFRLYLLSH